MIRHSHPKLIVAAIAFALTSACAFANAAPAAAAAAAAKKSAEAAKPRGQVVEYKELEHQIGAQIVVETNLNTARRGTLVKYTNPTLTLQLGPEAGSIELSVPHDSIRRITLVEPAPAPVSTQESGSAKKN
jgi:hypothetical protein